MTTLFVNACVRGDVSRTLELCREYLVGFEKVHEANLSEIRPQPLHAEQVAYRSQLTQRRMYDDPIYDLAKEFAEADNIVIGAPYWDLSFPAVLKAYFEHTTVEGIVFHYTPEATYEGMCKAKSLVYITTCGGDPGEHNMGYEYVRAIAEMYGIPNTYLIQAVNMDMVGADVEAELDAAREQISRVREKVRAL